VGCLGSSYLQAFRKFADITAQNFKWISGGESKHLLWFLPKYAPLLTELTSTFSSIPKQFHRITTNLPNCLPMCGDCLQLRSPFWALFPFIFPKRTGFGSIRRLNPVNLAQKHQVSGRFTVYRTKVATSLLPQPSFVVGPVPWPACLRSELFAKNKLCRFSVSGSEPVQGKTDIQHPLIGWTNFQG